MNTSSTRRALALAILPGACLLPSIALAQFPGTVKAWGDNFAGRLGTGSSLDSVNVPAVVPGLSGVVDVSAGRGHSLALLSDGTVRAWGTNAFGELGNGTYAISLVPVPVVGLSGIIAISAGFEYSLALRNDGTVWAWGRNTEGQLGVPPSASSAYAFQVPGLSGVIAIAAKRVHSLALLAGGTVRAWGKNDQSQLGNGTNIDSSTPVTVAGLSSVVAIASGALHSLALRTDGTIRAWGDNVSGQLGNGTTTDSNVPVPVVVIKGVTAIAGGGAFSLALRSNGTVQSWGSNFQGALGNGGAGTSSSVPVSVSGLSSVVAIQAGGYHGLALRSDGTARAWGWNFYGQLGNGNNTTSTVPVVVQNLNGAFRISTNNLHNLAIVAPVLSFPASIAFGSVTVRTSVSQLVTLANRGPGPLTLTDLSIAGTNASDFAVAGPPLPSTIAEGASVGVTVRFAPSASGSRTASLQIASNAFQSPHSVSLTGTGSSRNR